MRYRFALLAVLSLLVAGCGSTPAATKKPTATSQGAVLATVPVTTPVPVNTSTTKPGKGVITKLPTVKPFAAPTATALPASAFNALVSGVVTDSRDHSPISGALVVVGNGRFETKTNAFGHYRLKFPSAVPYPVQVQKTGYESRLSLGTLKPHQHVTLNFQLIRLVPGKPVAPPPPSIFGSH